MPINNSRLVFSFGNQWTKEKDAAPFFGLPAWWRRFMFQVLSPRELAVYLYLCSLMDPNAVAYPTVEQIAEDMLIKSRSVVVDALNALVERGFLLRGDDPYRGRVMGKRTIYQRPLPHFTIAKLLELNLIDADLYPTANATRNMELTKASDEVVRAGLRRLMGADNFAAFSTIKSPDRRRLLLLQVLNQHVEQMTQRETVEEQHTRADLDRVLENLSPSVRALVDEEMQEQYEIPF